MSYCRHCGKEIGDARFCPQCGTAQYAEQEKRTGGRRLHCPHCRSTKLTALVESADADNIFTESAASKGFGMATHGATAANRNYWMCHECGHKFRNIENLQSEIRFVEKETKIFRFIATVAGILALIIMAIAVSADDFLVILLTGPMCIFTMAAALGFWIYKRNKKKLAMLSDEEKNLTEKCYSN